MFVPNAAAAAIIERLGVELPFDIPLRARTEDEHRRALDAGIDQARRLGLLTPQGPPQYLVTALNALHAPDAAVHLIRGDIAARTDLTLHAARRAGTAVLAEVRTGDVVTIPDGWHGPSMAAPGYDLYYLNVMAGPSDERSWLICDDPSHAWVRQTWADQDVDPRVPMTTTEEAWR